ncbi:hypothetical protein [Mycobacterium shottsii]|uniref:hypothetical protein n=1 Tax=Mycobacterium shottsii TaxID=133549 RepID=UPI001E64FFED|nr:hypothetical protein [Mycobacterium shottsii]
MPILAIRSVNTSPYRRRQAARNCGPRSSINAACSDRESGGPGGRTPELLWGTVKSYGSRFFKSNYAVNCRYFGVDAIVFDASNIET